jgi:hypothetical protein
MTLASSILLNSILLSFQLSIISVFLIFLPMFHLAFLVSVMTFNSLDIPEFVPKNFKSPMYNYQTNWLRNVSLDDFQFFDSKKCLLCRYPIRNENPNSTPIDLYIMTMFRDVTGFLPLIRAFRSTGCKASIVLLLDQSAFEKLTFNHFHQLDGCGVKIYNIGPIEYKNIQTTSYGIIFDYILKNQNYINRILMTDIFDFVFQGDTFTEKIKSDTFYLETERQLVSENRKMKKLPFVHQNYDSNHHVISAGRFLGGKFPIMQMMDLYFSLFTKDYWGTTQWDDDQAIINYLVYSNLMKKYNISFVIDGPTRFNDWINLKKLDPFPNHQIGFVPDLDDLNHFASSIHQYDQIPVLVKTVYLSCPQ